ncbi:hypothetical protein Mal33_07010 [Rosistilla oblonga]|uniref:Uncharacterized protein n=1 Tax=Rosistilla oblonga TaxID=2527990 RepID=A0A518INS5_9BACT|nr:hypothetical protein Mal33_07010 [Rosistilla oblonga]
MLLGKSAHEKTSVAKFGNRGSSIVVLFKDSLSYRRASRTQIGFPSRLVQFNFKRPVDLATEAYHAVNVWSTQVASFWSGWSRVRRRSSVCSGLWSWSWSSRCSFFNDYWSAFDNSTRARSTCWCSFDDNCAATARASARSNRSATAAWCWCFAASRCWSFAASWCWSFAADWSWSFAAAQFFNHFAASWCWRAALVLLLVACFCRCAECDDHCKYSNAANDSTRHSEISKQSLWVPNANRSNRTCRSPIRLTWFP